MEEKHELHHELAVLRATEVVREVTVYPKPPTVKQKLNDNCQVPHLQCGR